MPSPLGNKTASDMSAKVVRNRATPYGQSYRPRSPKRQRSASCSESGSRLAIAVRARGDGDDKAFRELVDQKKMRALGTRI
jgi:hypothetical protein